MKKTRLLVTNTVLSALAMLGLASLMMAAMPQPAGSPAPGNPQLRPANAQNGPPPGVSLEIRIDPETLRQRLNRTIMRSQQTLDRSQSALAKLDAGASATEVLAELRLSGVSRRDDDGSRGGRASGGMAPEEREQMHAFLAEHFPDLWANLSPIIESDPRGADGLLARMAPQIREILFLRRTQPELGSIKIEQMRVGLDFVEASRVYRVKLNAPDATQSEKRDAMVTLRALAAARFDTDLRAKQFEIDRLEGRLDELRDSIEEIRARRDMEIEHMVSAAVLNARRQSRQLNNEGASGDD